MTDDGRGHLANRLHHVQIDIPKGAEEKARAFYAGVLGLESLDKPDELAGRGGCWFRLGDIEIHAGADPEFKTPSPKAHLALVIDDLEKARRILADSGARLETAISIPGFDRFYAYDPFGHRIEFMKPT